MMMIKDDQRRSVIKSSAALHNVMIGLLALALSCRELPDQVRGSTMDVVITMSHFSTSYRPSDSVRYSITITNRSSNPVKRVSLRDTVRFPLVGPLGPTGAVLSDSGISWNWDRLNGNDSITVGFTALIPPLATPQSSFLNWAHATFDGSRPVICSAEFRVASPDTSERRPFSLPTSPGLGLKYHYEYSLSSFHMNSPTKMFRFGDHVWWIDSKVNEGGTTWVGIRAVNRDSIIESRWMPDGTTRVDSTYEESYTFPFVISFTRDSISIPYIQTLRNVCWPNSYRPREEFKVGFVYPGEVVTAGSEDPNYWRIPSILKDGVGITLMSFEGGMMSFQCSIKFEFVGYARR